MFYSICLKYSFNLYLGVSIAISFYTEAEQQLKAGRLMSFVVATQVEGEGDVHGSKDPLPGSAQLLSNMFLPIFLSLFFRVWNKPYAPGSATRTLHNGSRLVVRISGFPDGWHPLPTARWLHRVLFCSRIQIMFHSSLPPFMWAATWTAKSWQLQFLVAAGFGRSESWSSTEESHQCRASSSCVRGGVRRAALRLQRCGFTLLVLFVRLNILWVRSGFWKSWYVLIPLASFSIMRLL